MEEYSIFSDFKSYIKENEPLIEKLSNSLLSDLVLPIIKTLTYLIKLNDEEELSTDHQELFQFGFEFLFENLEQIKLYLHEFNHNFEAFEKKSIYIKMIFQLEEYKVELAKMDSGEANIKHDLKRIDEAINFFEEHLLSHQINQNELDQYISVYYEISDHYEDILFMSDAFSEYCASYGI